MIDATAQSFAIKHAPRCLLLGEEEVQVPVDDPKRFVPFVLENSGRLSPEALAFLEYYFKTHSQSCDFAPS